MNYPTGLEAVEAAVVRGSILRADTDRLGSSPREAALRASRFQSISQNPTSSLKFTQSFLFRRRGNANLLHQCSEERFASGTCRVVKKYLPEAGGDSATMTSLMLSGSYRRLRAMYSFRFRRFISPAKL
jgi:hypothetical protein